jgi:hypothetical protein
VNGLVLQGKSHGKPTSPCQEHIVHIYYQFLLKTTSVSRTFNLHSFTDGLENQVLCLCQINGNVDIEKGMKSSREWLEHLAVNAKLAAILGSILAYIEGRQMKQCLKT